LIYKYFYNFKFILKYQLKLFHKNLFKLLLSSNFHETFKQKMEKEMADALEMAEKKT